MKTVNGKTERIHALDSLRAIMMLLGLVIHSAITYGVIDYNPVWYIKDPGATHLSMDYLVAFIHMYRMPIFFVVAGFFGALLFYERKPRKMIKNRIDRILYPLIVFVLLLWPTIVLTFQYTVAAFSGSATPLADVLAIFSNPLVFVPGSTFHLWFLYYLVMITLVSFGLALAFKKLPGASDLIHQQFNWIIRKPIVRVLFFSGLTFLILLYMQNDWVATSTSFIPDFNTFFFYFFFYMVGWVLFKSKHELKEMMRLGWLCTALACVLFTAKFFMTPSLSLEVTMAANALIVWLFVFGITGLFLRYGSNHSARMRYMSDSSYWIYLLHLPITALLPGLLAPWSASPFVKFAVVLSITTFICVITYHYCVRATFIGKFLNGRRYPRSVKHITVEKAPAAVQPLLVD